MPDAVNNDGKTRFLDFLARKKLRITDQRRAIVDTVFATQQHFSADQLLEWSRQRDKSVSRATVYRTLPLLTESGLVREMDFGKDHKFYDPNYVEHPFHNHVICLDCDKIVEFDSDKLAELEQEIRERFGFVVQSRRLYIGATCEEFRKLGTCSRRPGLSGSNHPETR